MADAAKEHMAEAQRIANPEPEGPIELDLSRGIQFLQMIGNGNAMADRAKFLNLKEAIEFCYDLAEKDDRFTIKVHPERADAVVSPGSR